MSAAIEALPSHSSEDSEITQRDDPVLFKAYWPMFQMMRNMAEDSATWTKLFKGDLRRLLEAHKRVASPQTCRNAHLLTGDATVGNVGCANWHGGEFLKIDAKGVTQSSKGPNTCHPIISDIVLVASITGVAIWGIICKYPSRFDCGGPIIEMRFLCCEDEKRELVGPWEFCPHFCFGAFIME